MAISNSRSSFELTFITLSPRQRKSIVHWNHSRHRYLDRSLSHKRTKQRMLTENKLLGLFCHLILSLRIMFLLIISCSEHKTIHKSSRRRFFSISGFFFSNHSNVRRKLHAHRNIQQFLCVKVEERRKI